MSFWFWGWGLGSAFVFVCFFLCVCVFFPPSFSLAFWFRDFFVGLLDGFWVSDLELWSYRRFIGPYMFPKKRPFLDTDMLF